ncbi:MAG: fimbria/pilus periplasmic chaperone [Aliidongia sp.]
MLVLAALIALCSLPAGTVEAASLEISPVIVDFAPGQTAATIVVQNHGETPVAVQARAYSWRRPMTTNLSPQPHDVILSPPIFTVPAGASQTVRLLLRGGSGSGAERSYRLLLDEVPPGRCSEQATRHSAPRVAAGHRRSVVADPSRVAMAIGARSRRRDERDRGQCRAKL